MQPQAILDLYDAKMRKDAPEGRAKIHKRPGLTYFLATPPSPRTGWVIYTHLAPEEADEAIRSTIEFFRENAGHFEWKVYDHDTPADLKDRLRAVGFKEEELETVLAFDLENSPAEFWEPRAADVRRLTEPGELRHVAQIQTAVWGEAEGDLEPMLAEEMRVTPDQLSVFVAFADGEPACSAWIRYYPGSPFAELYGGSTVPAHRGKGLYQALVQTRAIEARGRGVRFLIVDTSPMSSPILQRHGFVFLTHAQGFVMDFDGAGK